MRKMIPLLCLLVAATAALARSTSFEESARPGEQLVVDLETGGSIRISGWNRNLVSVEAEFTGRDSDDIDFGVERTDRGVRVFSRYATRRRSHGSSTKVKIRVPDRFDLRLETTGGEIEIDGVEGEIRGETMGGRLTLRELRGTVELSTMGGNITLTDSELDGNVSTMGGNIRLENVVGDVDAETYGGNVLFENVTAATHGRCREVRIKTMGGNIRAPDAGCGADLETLGGNIRIERAAEYVKAETMGGNIFVGAVGGWIRATTMGGKIDVTMIGDPGSGRRDARLISMGGDVTLTVPQGLSMEVDVTLAFTKRSTQDYSIESDFPLSIRRADDWDYADGEPRKYIYGTGTFDGGEHKIKIETVNGDVRLRRGS